MGCLCPSVKCARTEPPTASQKLKVLEEMRVERPPHQNPDGLLQFPFIRHRIAVPLRQISRFCWLFSRESYAIRILSSARRRIESRPAAVFACGISGREREREEETKVGSVTNDMCSIVLWVSFYARWSFSHPETTYFTHSVMWVLPSFINLLWLYRVDKVHDRVQL